MQLGHNVSVDEIKTNTRQQLLVKHLEDRRLLYCGNWNETLKYQWAFSASVFKLLKKQKENCILTQYREIYYTLKMKHLPKVKSYIVRHFWKPQMDIII